MSSRDRSKGYRAPQANGSKDAPARPGLLGGLFAPRAAAVTSMPGIGSSIARGFTAVVTSPVLVVAIPLLVVVEWFVALALGYQGPFTQFAGALAIPPFVTLYDNGLSTALFGPGLGRELILAFVLVRAIVLGLLTAAVVQQLDQDRVDQTALRRGLLVIPTAFAVGIISMLFVTAASLVAAFLVGLGSVVALAGLVFAVYLFVFAPIMVAAERRSMPEALSRSLRAGRMPGAGNLAFAALYVLISFIFLQLGLSLARLGVNPTFADWAFVLLANLVQVVFLASFAFRYLSVTDEVPAAPEPRQRGSRRR